MLAKCPPAEIPHFLKAPVWTVEEGHVLCHPLPCLRIRNGLHDVLVLHRIEVVHIVLVVAIFQERRHAGGGFPVGTHRFCTDIGDGIARLSVRCPCIFEGTVPVGRGIYVWEPALASCTEHDAFYAFHWSKEHALTGLLAIDEYLCHTA